ncbi:MAG: hypothetical protein SVU32_07540, partial [Candidatus Nanohaloarchaea archaeon]|nr:hypothetical protein [Candidatus Nanohaloarchaea archaeon]
GNNINNINALNGVEVDHIRVEASGLSADDTTRGVWMNGTKIFTQGRSYGLVVIDRDTHEVTFKETYDVYGDATEARRLGKKLQSLTKDK